MNTPIPHSFALPGLNTLARLPLLNWWMTARRTEAAPSTPSPITIQQHHLAWQRAARRFAQQHPQWTQRRFDEEFLRRFIGSLALPTAAELALAWEQQFGPLIHPSARCQQRVELTEVAACFLRFYQSERQQIEGTSAR